MKLELSSVDDLGRYTLASVPAREVASFTAVGGCPACAGRAWEDLVALGGRAGQPALTLRRCGGCGHLTYDRLPDDAWAAQRRIARPRPAVPRRRTSPWQSDAHLRDLGLPADARVLDFARGSSLEEVQALAAEGGPFELITVHHVASHLRDPAATLAALAELLRPRGVLAVAVPHPGSQSPLHLPLYLAHLHHFTPASLRHVLARAGLRTWRWSRSTTQLAIAGSLTALPRGAAHYELDDAGPGTAASTVAYVAAPWQLAERRPVTLRYFHPWLGPPGNRGFEVIEGLTERWWRGPACWAAPVIARLDRRQRLRGAVAGSRLRYLASSSASPIPWLTRADGDVPILVR